MRFVDIINKKREKQPLTTEEIQFWIDGYVKNEIPDYQVSALCMAIVLNGMEPREISDLTKAMMNSGEVMDLSSIEGIKIDKHSTGGVGDKTSLALMPMVSSCGAKVAKMSGRGLGHTGGTLDKLESIQNFNIFLDDDAFAKQVNDISIAIIGQTAQLVPADKKLYALRDVTGTVQSIPLIASSIMSKKLASGADTILLDVKYGDGAFMHTPEEAIELAKTMIQIGKDCGRDTRAMITDMNQPLGHAIGNALEVKEAIDTLKGQGPKDFTELCYTAGSIILQQAKIVNDEASAREMLEKAVEDGRALNKLKEMVQAQGGCVDQIDHPERLPQAKMVVEMRAHKNGYLDQVKALALGTLAMKLGAGRATKEDPINYAVGIVLNKKVGDSIQEGDIIAYVHTDEELSTEWIKEFYETFLILPEPVSREPLIYQIL
ncbi:MAG: pyrimidine-nucleoside phosphorylase [Erysipelotrichaceae bacterium]|nr:pyrimidine-nucleoside phosphorylase [Erysipelotrichaceae bacterium]